MRSVVIVGASLAGFSAAQALRRHGFDGTITLVGEEPHLPYQRPPLSKQFLCGAWDRARLDLRVADGLQLDWVLGMRAHSLDLSHRDVILADNRRLHFDGMVIATGARPRKPKWYAELEGVFTLRTVDDAIALRAHLATRKRSVAIVGAGFIGSEVAATLRSIGCDVTLIDVDRVPMLRVLGEQLGSVCVRLHQAHGVRMIFGVAVSALVGSEAVEGVRLADGSVVEADCVVVGVGVIPNVDWLANSGVRLDDGVACDAACSALGVERVVVAGDAACWRHPHYGRIRIEHWDNAIAQADAAARALIESPGAARAYAPIPFFWSDQHGCKLQMIGVPRREDTMRIIEGALDEPRFVALFERDGRARAAFLFNSMHRVAAYRQMIETALANRAEGAMA